MEYEYLIPLKKFAEYFLLFLIGNTNLFLRSNVIS